MNILIFALSLAQAQNTDSVEPIIMYSSKTLIDFEGSEVKGEIVSPNGSVVSEPIRPDFNPLLKLRYDFQDELNASVNLIK